MRILVFSYDYHPFNRPTAKMIHKILQSFPNEHLNVDVVSKGNLGFVSENNICNYQCFDFDDSKKKTLSKIFYKIRRKIFSKFSIWGLFDSKRLYKVGKKLIKQNNYDCVLSFSGVFCAHEAATMISKKFKIPLFLFYADPFISNWVLRNKNPKTLSKIELKWLNTAKKVFLPSNYLSEYVKVFPTFSNKFVSCELPGFFDDEELSVIRQCPIVSNMVVYAGDFFVGFRKPNNLILLANNNLDFDFFILGFLDPEKFGIDKLPDNIKIIGRKSGLDYLKIIGSAAAFYLEDNSFPNQIPYKTFEYVSTGKPIIYSTNNKNSATSLFLNHYNRTIMLPDFNSIFRNNAKSFFINNHSVFEENEYKRYKTNFVSNIIFRTIKEYIG